MYSKTHLSEETIEQWLKEVIDDGLGYLKVSDSGGNWIAYEDGAFHMKFRRMTKEVYKPKELVKEIFRKRIKKYNNVAHDGFYYYYDRGGWKRQRTTFNYD